jgi:cell division protein FtsI (penicillin-binding protein 3)
MVYPEPEEDDTVIPDFQGMSLREVLRMAQRRGIEIKTAGTGWAVNQNPAPGVSIEGNQPCYVLFDREG